jgi:hypothetical protein
MAWVMAGGLSASIVASLAFFYFESSHIAGQLEERSLFRQTRLLLKDFAVAENGGVTIKMPTQSEKAYKDREGTFAYTIFDPEGRPVAVSPNIDAPLPFFHEALKWRIDLLPSQHLTDTSLYFHDGTQELR